MSSDDLIDRLVADLHPVRANLAPWRIVVGLGAGAIVAVVLMLTGLGPRPDLADAIASPPFWMKFAYTLALVVFGGWAFSVLARPGGAPRGAAIGICATITLLAVIAALELLTAAPDSREALLLGATASVCPFNIVILSLPVFLGALWAMRGLAPTQLPLAGAATGIVAGAIGAWVYAFHCNESAASFVVLWYTAGIAGMTGIGWLLGRPMLRW